MLFIVMPSPPQAKIITDSDEIVPIIDLLNRSNKIGSGVVIGMQSWVGQIRYNGQIYYISKANSIVINGIEYKTDKEIVKQLFEAYEKSNALEEDFAGTILERFNNGKL